MLKLLVRVILFFVVVIGVNMLVLTQLPYGWSEQVSRDKLANYALYGNAYNTLMFGSSRTFRQVVPEVYDETMGDSIDTKSFNMGVSGFLHNDIEQIYRAVLESTPPNLEYVLFELSPARTKPATVNLHTTRLVSSYNLRDAVFLIKALFDEDISLNEKYRYTGIHLMSLVERQLNMGLGADIVEYLYFLEPTNLRRFNGAFGFQPLVDPGAGSLHRRRTRFERNPALLEKRTTESRDAFRSGQQRIDHNAAFMQNLDELLRISEENGIQLIFVLYPRMGEEYESLLPLYNRLPSENRVSLASPDEYEQFYVPELSFDEGHLTEEGANIFSTLLAEEVATIISDTVDSTIE